MERMWDSLYAMYTLSVLAAERIRRAYFSFAERISLYAVRIRNSQSEYAIRSVIVSEFRYSLSVFQRNSLFAQRIFHSPSE